MKKAIIGLIILLGLNSCGFYAEISEDEIEISEENLTAIKSIQDDISQNFEFIADSNGYFSDRFYFESARFDRKLKIIKPDNYKKLVDLNQKGTIKSLRIIRKDCSAYLLQFIDPNTLFHKYWDEVWLVYYNDEDSQCGIIDNSDGKTVWTKKIDDKWMLVKNKRKRYIGG